MFYLFSLLDLYKYMADTVYMPVWYCTCLYGTVHACMVHAVHARCVCGGGAGWDADALGKPRKIKKTLNGMVAPTVYGALWQVLGATHGPGLLTLIYATRDDLGRLYDSFE